MATEVIALSRTEAGQGSAFAHDLRLFALAALNPVRLEQDSPTNAHSESRLLLDFLRSASASVSDSGLSWAAALAEYLRHPLSKDRLLLSLAAQLGMQTMECLAVALAVSVETDVMTGRAVAMLQAPLGGSRPTLGLLASALAELAPTASNPIEVLVTGVASRSGLLAVQEDGPPLAERVVSVPTPLCLALGGYDAVWPTGVIGVDETSVVPLSPSIEEEIARRAKGLAGGSQRALALRTGSTAEGRSVASGIAQQLGLRPLFLASTTDSTLRTSSQHHGLTPFLHLRKLLPVFCFELAPGERKALPVLPHYQGSLLALSGPEGSVEFNHEAVTSWRIPVPRRSERKDLWQDALDNEELATTLATQHRHGCGRIAQLGKVARRAAFLSARERPILEDVVEASWSSDGSGLDTLAQPLADRIPDDAFIMTPHLREELESLLLRCRARDQLVEGLGASAVARYRTGVRALFLGPSGTGKTLGAGWLATRLGLPLYRVDLAAVTSKYIGETEKNLAQLLARAEQSEVVLLFDEADSLFGKRTDVKEANDRFANAQTNYLLQRIESYDGITILTSNSRGRFDSAFSRRLDMIIEFPPPGPEERRSLWQSHLGNNHNLSQRDLNKLSAVADLFGAHIRNAVLSAATLAQSEGRPIEIHDIYAGVTGEYRKLGRQMPTGLTVKSEG